MDLSPRLRRRIARDFPEPGSAEGIADLVASAVESLPLADWPPTAIERIQAAIVIGGSGDLARVRHMRDLALQDWRDLLLAADLGNQDWARRLDAELGLP
ncbi:MULTISPECIES: hypothetical protein [unclassified Kribbella]|uniref:hypothetical protein n=1 Tax=unclassified Kribbella TaxID=2644121 RepID=UPI0033E6C764